MRMPLPRSNLQHQEETNSLSCKWRAPRVLVAVEMLQSIGKPLNNQHLHREWHLQYDPKSREKNRKIN